MVYIGMRRSGTSAAGVQRWCTPLYCLTDYCFAGKSSQHLRLF